MFQKIKDKPKTLKALGYVPENRIAEPVFHQLLNVRKLSSVVKFQSKEAFAQGF